MACKDYHDHRARRRISPRASTTRAADWQRSRGRRPFPKTRFAYHISLACNHCASPACTQVCPTGAMHQRRDGACLARHHQVHRLRLLHHGLPLPCARHRHRAQALEQVRRLPRAPGRRGRPLSAWRPAPCARLDFGENGRHLRAPCRIVGRGARRHPAAAFGERRPGPTSSSGPAPLLPKVARGAHRSTARRSAYDKRPRQSFSLALFTALGPGRRRSFHRHSRSGAPIRYRPRARGAHRPHDRAAVRRCARWLHRLGHAPGYAGQRAARVLGRGNARRFPTRCWPP